MTTLIIGPVRSGKSARALALARASARPVIFAATAREAADDAEWRARIARHRSERPSEWRLVETASGAGPSLEALLADAAAGSCVVVDALGTWLSAEMEALGPLCERDPGAASAVLERRGDELARALATCRADAIVVGEETGWGLVPPNRLGRLFRDALGRLVRAVARSADRVELVVAGYALDLRAAGRPVDEVAP